MLKLILSIFIFPSIIMCSEKQNIVEVLEKYNKAFEVNSYYHPNIEKIINECLKEGTLISLGSNAHSIKEIGKINSFFK